jgi:hypothetical protein
LVPDFKTDIPKFKIKFYLLLILWLSCVPPKQNQEDTNKLNRPTMSNEIETVIIAIIITVTPNKGKPRTGLIHQ